MPSYQLTGKSRHGDLYIGHRTDTPASALAKFVRWRYGRLGQRYVDRLVGEAFRLLSRNKSGSLTLAGWSLHLHTDPRPPTRR